MILTKIFLIIISVNASFGLYQTAFTYRFSEWIQKDEIKNNCGWTCECPQINLEQLCNCEKADEQITIESPYAALLIQMECDPPKQDLDWRPKPMIVEIPATAEKQIPEYLTYEISGKEPVLKSAQLMPKNDLEIKYRFAYSSEDSIVWKHGFDKVKIVDPDNLYVLIPGWTSDVGKLFDSMHRGILDLEPSSVVLIVDWLHANQFYFDHEERIYEQSAANGVYIGCHLAANLHLARHDGPFENTFIHIIGFDLGSHIAHFTGHCFEEFFERVNQPGIKIDRITALDPPFYLFADDGLSENSASYVDVIHSNSMAENKSVVENLKMRKFGDNRRLGHADIYVNYVDGDHNHELCARGPEPAPFGCAGALSGTHSS